MATVVGVRFKNAGKLYYFDPGRLWPAAGSSNSAIELTLDELERVSGARGWVDVGRGWREGE